MIQKIVKDNNGPNIFQPVDDLKKLKSIICAVDDYNLSFPKYDEFITHCNISNLKDNEPYIYHCNIISTDYFEKFEITGFKDISPKVKKDVNEGKAAIVLSNIFEAYSGKDTILGNRDFEILDKWIAETNLNPKNIWYLTGNLLAHNLYQSLYSYNIVSLTMQEEWNDCLKFSDIELTFKPFDTGYLYVCLNRQPRSHRIFLLANLIKHNLFDKGQVSFNLMNEKYAHLTHCIKMYDESMINYASNLEKIGNKYLDFDNTDNLSNNVNSNLMEGTFISLVTETLCDGNTLQFSEKIWKPIMCGHPFMILSSNHTLETLKNLGFKTYSDWFDESYDNCSVINKVAIICDNLLRYNNYSIDQLREIRYQMKEVARYNQEVLKSHVKNKFFDTLGHKDYNKPLSDWIYSIYKILK